MPQLHELGFTHYKDYLKTRWWKELTHKEITLRPDSQCFICHKKYPKSHLVIHHVSYKNLGCEKKGRDFFILCHNCHTEEHFTLYTHEKIPLEEKILRKRLYLLKYTYSIRKLRPSDLFSFAWKLINLD